MEAGFDKEAVMVIDAAHLKAKDDGVKEIGIYHVLAALLDYQNDAFRERLNLVGIDPSIVKSQVSEMYQCHGKYYPPGQEFSQKMEDVLKLSASKAKSEERLATPVDILFSILSLGNRFGALFGVLKIPQTTNPEQLYTDSTERGGNSMARP
jgi:ATP-dependent Clp protease ATP-binding subunit ClpA